MAMETPILSVGRLRDALVAVAPPGGDLWAAEDRLPVEPIETPGAELRGNGTLLRLLSFP